MNRKTVIKLTESAVMIAIATVLGLIRIVELPYGGSVTIASMLPIVIIAYRNGMGYGLISGLVYGAIQQLLGLHTLSWVSTWQSVLAVILLDYIIAFAVIGFSGIFRSKKIDQAAALTLGALFVCVLRYMCHVISGATVWAGLSVPTAGALINSFAYNATYMIPETIVLLITAYYIGSMIDFRTGRPTRLIRHKDQKRIPVIYYPAGLCIVGALIFDIASVFSKLQNGVTGEWNIAGLSQVNWIAVMIVSLSAALIAAVLCLIAKKTRGNKNS